MKTALHLTVAAAALVISAAANAQFESAPPAANAAKRASTAATPKDYKAEGARHLYNAYAKHVWKGKMRPNLYGVAIIETEIDASGQVVDVRIVRQPAAAEVGPWAVNMIKQASPFPAPQRIGNVKYQDIWLVDKSGKFQLDTLTQGQL